MKEEKENIYLHALKLKTLIMKKGIHPENYRLVVFKDMSNDYSFLSKSCANSKDTVKWEDGNEYPLIHFLLGNNNLLIQLVELISLKVDTPLKKRIKNFITSFNPRHCSGVFFILTFDR